MDHFPALRRQQSPSDHQQSHAAASSGSRDRCVIQILLTSATTRGLPLRGNASANDSYDNTRGSDAVPVVRVDHHQPHIVADNGESGSWRDPDSTNASGYACDLDSARKPTHHRQG